MRQSQWTPAPPVGTAASRAPSIPSARYARAAVRVVEGTEMLSDVVMDIVAREQIGDLVSLELQHPAMPPKRKTQSVLRLFGILTRMRSFQFNSTRQAGRLLTALKKRGLTVRQGSDKCGIWALKSPESDIAVTGARETHDI